MTVTVEIIQDGVFNLLSGMENLGLIRVNNPETIENLTKKKLSEQFAGAFQMSEEIYKAYQNSIQESRNEWTRLIY